jgi:hypothetical protein
VHRAASSKLAKDCGIVRLTLVRYGEREGNYGTPQKQAHGSFLIRQLSQWKR